jgi:hypothetical protein
MPEEIMGKVKLEGGFRTKIEQQVGNGLENIFKGSPDSIEIRLENFTKYIKRQRLTRLLALYEIFKKILPLQGSIIECGVYRGFSLMAWAHFSAILEPVNLTRRIYGFDTFRGFPGVTKEDKSRHCRIKSSCLSSDSFNELVKLIEIFDSNRFLGHVNKVQLIKGNAVKTMPKFIKDNKHLVVSLLFLDFDLYRPTKAAIENFLPRMPKGAIIAFDELDNPLWPGETMALLKSIGINKLKIQRIDFDPYIGYSVIDKK